LSTNTPGKRADIRGITVPATEVSFSFDGVPTVLNFVLQATTEVAVYVGLTEGSTFDTTNRFTVKSGARLRFDDVNWTPDTNALYLRSAGAETLVECWYWG